MGDRASPTHMMQKLLILLLATLELTSLPARSESFAPPSNSFDLRDWKINIPGPVEIKDLQGYASKYFDLNGLGEMCFHLDAAEKGTTPNTHFVRSELRHLPNWRANEHHSLSAVVHTDSHLSPDKVTVVQIHGMTDDKKNAPPLLRVALNDGDLVAIIKTDSAGKQNDTTMLVKGLGPKPVKIDVVVEGGQLKVLADGQQKVTRSLAFWPYQNYFKAGCYPQATNGTVDVMFSSLSAK
jgi:hypothetical protein